MKGKKEEMRIPMKFEEAVADFLKVKPAQKSTTKELLDKSEELRHESDRLTRKNSASAKKRLKRKG